jgi:hypothetical protein
MAAAEPDPEKQAPEPASHYATSSSTLRNELPAKETVIETHLARSSRASSTDTDPLSPLEHALGQTIAAVELDVAASAAQDDDDGQDDEQEETDNPVDLTRTRTSVTSAASRPPDFEVTLDADDPENPKNWSALLPPPLIVSRLLIYKRVRKGPSGTAPTPS